MNKKIFSKFKLAPLRSLDDFLRESVRFQIPNVQDLEKWKNRVTCNLLYYQTNYFFLALIIFLITGGIHPRETSYGFLLTGLIILIFLFVTNERPTVTQFKRNHPIISFLSVFIAGYLIHYMFKSLLVFLLDVLLPISVTFMHSSLRLRNLKNKLVNRVDPLGLERTTPMAFLLEKLGMKQEIQSLYTTN